MLIGKHPVQHQEFFAERVLMRGECAGGSITDQRGRARDLAANAIEHAALDARLRGGDPWQFAGCYDHTLGEVGVDALVRHRTVSSLCLSMISAQTRFRVC